MEWSVRSALRSCVSFASLSSLSHSLRSLSSPNNQNAENCVNGVMVGEESTGQLLRSFSHTFALSLTISPWNSRNEWTKRMRDGNENGAVSKGKRTVSERTTVTDWNTNWVDSHTPGLTVTFMHLPVRSPVFASANRLLTSYGSA